MSMTPVPEVKSPPANAPTCPEEACFAPQPTERTKLLRTFVPLQFIRFVVINLKMIKMISISHE